MECHSSCRGRYCVQVYYVTGVRQNSHSVWSVTVAAEDGIVFGYVTGVCQNSHRVECHSSCRGRYCVRVYYVAGLPGKNLAVEGTVPAS